MTPRPPEWAEALRRAAVAEMYIEDFGAALRELWRRDGAGVLADLARKLDDDGMTSMAAFVKGAATVAAGGRVSTTFVDPPAGPTP